jgi:alanyl-tRNA synthetase
MTSNEIRQKFLDFFAARGHAVLPSAPLIPESDGGDRNVTLFNVAGMQPFMPYLLGEDHPQGKRLVNSQKCLRTVDIDEVGDNTHATFFEMLGNWSLGDYFKEDAIKWSYEFLTNSDEGLGLDVHRLYVTVFAGNDVVPQDNESKKIWMQLGIPEDRIYYRDGKDNWWTAGPDSPAGPSTEMFYDLTDDGLGDMTAEEFEAADERQDVVEIWNDVFMAYRQEGGTVVAELPNKNVDTGSGLERITAVVQGKKSIFDTDLFEPAISFLRESSFASKNNPIDFNPKERDLRIIADHMRAVLFLMSEGLLPSNTGRGYILRRLIRRAMTKAYVNGLNGGELLLVAQILKDAYKDSVYYENLLSNDQYVYFKKEINSFEKTLASGMKEFEKGERDAFTLFTTYGFPLEMTQELAAEKDEEINVAEFEQKMKEHQEKSRSSSAGQFKGGLSDVNDPAVVKLHTAHHLLLAALQQVLGDNVKQRGSNITPERLRIDFTFDRKMTPEEKVEVEKIVNDKISESLPVMKKEMPREEAESIGAQMEFGQKYPDIVNVYFVGDPDTAFSKEFCGGPHVENTSDLGVFKIKKEESSSKGIRRIKAVLQ